MESYGKIDKSRLSRAFQSHLWSCLSSHLWHFGYFALDVVAATALEDSRGPRRIFVTARSAVGSLALRTDGNSEGTASLVSGQTNFSLSSASSYYGKFHSLCWEFSEKISALIVPGCVGNSGFAITGTTQVVVDFAANVTTRVSNHVSNFRATCTDQEGWLSAAL